MHSNLGHLFRYSHTQISLPQRPYIMTKPSNLKNSTLIRTNHILFGIFSLHRHGNHLFVSSSPQQACLEGIIILFYMKKQKDIVLLAQGHTATRSKPRCVCPPPKPRISSPIPWCSELPLANLKVNK